MKAFQIKRIITLLDAIKCSGLFTGGTAVHVVVAQEVVLCAGIGIPNVHKTLIGGDRLAKIAHLNHEIGFAFFCGVQEDCQALICVIHRVFVDVGDQADADFLRFFQGEAQQKGDADCGGVFEEGTSLHGDRVGAYFCTARHQK